MSRKIVLISFLAVAFSVMGLSDGHAFQKEKYAREGKSRMMGMHHQVDFDQKFFSKVHFLKAHQDEIGLGEDQIGLIRDLKLKVKKEIIRKNADMDVLKVDIDAKLYEKELDLETINALIDKKYEIKKAKTKYLVKAYADLKNILTDEQYAAMKKIWRSKES